MNMLITVDLPDSLAKKVGEAGLLAPGMFARVMREAMRRRAFDNLIRLGKMGEANGPPMTMDEIQAEVNAVRARMRRMRERQDKQERR